MNEWLLVELENGCDSLANDLTNPSTKENKLMLVYSVCFCLKANCVNTNPSEMWSSLTSASRNLIQADSDNTYDCSVYMRVFY